MSEVHYKISDLANIGSALSWVQDMIERGIKAGPVVVTMGRETRNTDQNAKMWPMLTDISKQVQWCGQWLEPGEWKDLATGTFRKCKVVPNLDGTGVVVVGLSTSKMKKPEFCEFIEYLYAFGAEHNVQWSEPSNQVITEHRRGG